MKIKVIKQKGRQNIPIISVEMREIKGRAKNNNIGSE